MKNLLIAITIILTVFAYTLFNIDRVTASNFFGFLGFSVAVGSIGFFSFFAPFGKNTHAKVFGKMQPYRFPAAVIPPKIKLAIFISVFGCLAISFGFFTYAA